MDRLFIRPIGNKMKRYKPLFESESVYYHGGKETDDLTKPYLFYTKDLKYAEKYAHQRNNGKVFTVKINNNIKIYPEPIWWQEWDTILSWNPKQDPRFHGYDAVPIIEPNGEENSIVILNPKIVKEIAE